MEKIIYTKKLALELRKAGFKLLRTGINENFPQYDTYIFEDSEELRQAISKINTIDKGVNKYVKLQNSTKSKGNYNK